MKIVVHAYGFLRASEGREHGQCDQKGPVEQAERRQMSSSGHNPGQRFSAGLSVMPRHWTLETRRAAVTYSANSQRIT